ncbi:MAG: peroxiredoxin family protein [Bradymonadaceae bacterium]
MLIRRQNWPAFLAIAILGPLLGAYVGATALSGSCPFSTVDRAGASDAKRASAPTQQTTPDEPERPTFDQLVFPDGDRAALSELSPTRPTAIVVMKAPWCPVCQRQLKALSQRLNQVQHVGGSVVGLTTADAETNAELRRKLRLDFPILGDPSKSLHKKLNLWIAGQGHAMPGVIFLDDDGDIAKIHRGRYPGQKQAGYILKNLQKLSD